MIKNILLLILFIPPCFADLKIPQSSLTESFVLENEVAVVDQLITSAQDQLKSSRTLKELMIQFNKQREEFVMGDQSKSHTARLVNTARQIFEMIEINHIEHLFAKDYIEELAFFSSIAGKTTVSRP